VAIKEIGRHEKDEAALIDIEKAWQIEAEMLTEITRVEHENLIRCIAAITCGRKYYFVFPWADGGSLREYWDAVPQPPLLPHFVRDVLVQLLGLAGALEQLHNYGRRQPSWRFRQEVGAGSAGLAGGGGIRHGDLKPENILRFDTRGDPSRIGTLKIADMGLAKHHDVATRLRPNTSGTKFGTARYEPPEVDVPTLAGTSRLYDVWSMGCIMLETIIWLLHGTQKLADFNDALRAGRKHYPPYYHVRDGIGETPAAEVHPDVRACMDELAQDPECRGDTALGDLLRLVRTQLLVVALPPQQGVPQPGAGGPVLDVTPAPGAAAGPRSYRASATALVVALNAIVAKAAVPGYLVTGRSRTDPQAGGFSYAPAAAPPGAASLHQDAARARRGNDSSGREQDPMALARMRDDVSTYPSPH